MLSQVGLLEIRKLLHHLKSHFGTFEINNYINFLGLFKLARFIYVNSDLLKKKITYQKTFFNNLFSSSF